MGNKELHEDVVSGKKRIPCLTTPAPSNEGRPAPKSMKSRASDEARARWLEDSRRPTSAVPLPSRAGSVREVGVTVPSPDYLVAEERVMRQHMEMELMSLERWHLIWTVESRDEQVHHTQEVLAELRQEMSDQR